MRDNPAKTPRLPYIAALLCAACLGTAVWTWMRYSYCWRMTRNEAIELGARLAEGHWPAEAYIELVCPDASIADGESHSAKSARAGSYRGRWRLAYETGSFHTSNLSISSAPYCALRFKAASRFHGASVAGLVVGAMGVFVFTVALRHWLGERRKFGEDTRGHNTSVEADTL